MLLLSFPSHILHFCGKRFLEGYRTSHPEYHDLSITADMLNFLVVLFLLRGEGLD